MTAFLILLMIAVPSACFGWLLPALDPLGRAMVGVASALCLLILVVQVMIIFRVWSPLGGTVAVVVICAGLVAVGLRRRPAHEAEVQAAQRAHEDEDWLFDE